MKQRLQAVCAIAFVAAFLIGLHVVLVRHHGNSAEAQNNTTSQPASQPEKVMAPATAVTTERPAPLKLKVVATAGNKQISFGELIDQLMQADIICVGEQHDSALDHQVQLQIIKAVFARNERVGAAMEMFQKPFQPVLDDYIAGKIGEEQFLKDTQYQKRWGFDWKLYRSIVEFCRRNEVPVAALNVPKELTSRMYKVGYGGLTDEEKKVLGPIDFNVKSHRDYWYELLPKMHGLDNATKQQKDRSYEIMTSWDDFMAQNAAAFKKDRQLDKVVVLAGIGHVAGGFGIPNRAAQYATGRSVTVRIVIDGNDTGADEGSELPVDYTVHVQK